MKLWRKVNIKENPTGKVGFLGGYSGLFTSTIFCLERALVGESPDLEAACLAVFMMLPLPVIISINAFL